MDLNLINKLITMVTNSKLKSLEIKDDDIFIKLENSAFIDTSSKLNEDTNIIYEPKKEKVNNIIKEDKVLETNNEDIKKEYGNIVKSPIVGTIYLSSQPGKPEYVSVGTKVKKGDVLCIIEAMKLMNEIVSEYDGVVTKIHRNNEDTVEYGMPLFTIA